MKRTFIFISGFAPWLAFATSAGMLLAGVNNIPDDFRTYFYQSEMPVRVLLNDRVLFEASMQMHPNGSMSLVSVIAGSGEISEQTQKRWEERLRKGVESGQCEKSCTDGLISADYNLNNSVLRLLTSHYEKERVAGDYVSLPEKFPNGLIINNDFSAIQSSSNDLQWSLYSDMTASLGGWSHSLAFQSSHQGGQYSYNTTDLYDLYSQKEHAGHFLRTGFSPPTIITAMFKPAALATTRWRARCGEHPISCLTTVKRLAPGRFTSMGETRPLPKSIVTAA